MNFSFYIAKRYVFAKSSTNAINIITIISASAVIIGSLALFIILSGFSGLRTFTDGLLDISDPDVRIESAKGKSFIFTDSIASVIEKNKEIKDYALYVEERVLLSFKNKDEVSFIKGVTPNYNKITKIDSTIVVGQWLDSDFDHTGILGRGIAYKLSLGGLQYSDPLKIRVPKPGNKVSLNPASAFNEVNVQVTGIYSGAEEFSNKYIFVNISLAQKLLSYSKKQISGIDIKIKGKEAMTKLVSSLKKSLGENYTVKTKAELNEVFFKVVNTENFVSYLIFTFIVIIALFNLIGAIIMIILDKEKNIKTLYNLGATLKEIRQIFILQGGLLNTIAMVIGLSIGLLLIFMQKTYAFFEIVPGIAYPIEFRWKNLFIVIATISVLGFIAVRIASNSINEKMVNK